MAINSSRRKLNRRQFLQLAGATGAAALPTLLGFRLIQEAEGQLPRSVSPFELGRESEGSLLTSSLLLLVNERTDNPFAIYLAEILRAEGLNCFQSGSLAAMKGAALGRFDLIILTEGTLDGAELEALEGYVSRGGRLVAMRPNARLAPMLGLERASGATADGYLRIEQDHPFGQGAIAEALRFHGTADHYRLAGAEVVAWLSDDPDRLTSFPAVTVHRYGKGQASLWAFDLARSVVYTRQGNPDWSGQERDGREGIRALDAFVGWVDLDRIATPQADELMRLFSRSIAEMLSSLLPLPRLWYFPGRADGMLIATGDAHYNSAAAIEDVLSQVERRGGRMSVYYSPPLSSVLRRAGRRVKRWAEGLPVVGDVLANPHASPTPSQVADWRARGHEFGLHPYVEQGLEEGWRRYWQEFTGLGYGAVPPTTRTHRVLWEGWVESARVQATHGMGLNLDYYHIGPTFQKENGEWAFGHFTGSGLPMKFVDEQGRIINIYQQLTQLVDEHLLEVPWGAGGWVKLSAEDAVEVSRTLLQCSKEGGYSSIAAQFHIDPFEVGGQFAPRAKRWLEGTLDYATELGFPIWSAAEWLRFTEVRHEAMLNGIHWDAEGKRLSFALASPTAQDAELSVMVPLQHGESGLSEIVVDGQPIGYRKRKLSGVGFGCVAVEAGSHELVATYA